MKKLLAKFWSLKEEYFVFWASLAFYVSLYFSVNNKTLLGLFFLFLLIFYKRFKSLPLSLFFVYLLFLPFSKGKNFDFVLIPAQILGAKIPYTYGLTITFADLAFLSLFILILREEIMGRKVKSLKPKREDIFLFMFFVFVCLSLFFSQFQAVSFLAFLKLIRMVAVYFLVRRLLAEKTVVKFFPLVLVSLLFFQGAWGSLQFLFQRPLGRAIEPFGTEFSAYGHVASDEVTFFRATGTFEHPNTLGSFLVMFLPFFIIQIFNFRQSRWRQIVFFGGFLLGVLGLVFSASRASWIIFLSIGFLAVIFLKKRRLFVISPLIKKWLVLITIVVVFLFLPLLILPRFGHLYLSSLEGKSGVYYRTYLLEKAWFLVQEAPLGIGLATFPAVLIDRFSFFSWPTPVHNLWFEILVETGIFSLMSILLFLIFAYKRFFLSLKKTSNNDHFFLKTGAFFATLGFLGVAEFYPFFWSSGIFEYFWLFLGIMVYYKRDINK